MKQRANILLLALLLGFQAFASNPDSIKVKLGGLYYLNWHASWLNSYLPRSLMTSEFYVRRAYFDFRVSMWQDKILVRWTPDIFVSLGKPLVRLKYAYAQFRLTDWKFLHNPRISFGQMPRAWLKFEEMFNPYKVLDDMFVERMKLLNSADLGIAFEADWGEKLESGLHLRGKNLYPGSFFVGLFNGGGYMQPEYNLNKVVEMRFSVRPVRSFPWFLYSFTGLWGKPNNVPSLAVDSSFVLLLINYFAYTHERFVLAVQGEYGHSSVFPDMYVRYDYQGVVPVIRSLWHQGFSVFSDIGLSKRAYFFVRYDWFWAKEWIPQYQRTIFVGFRYNLQKDNFLAITYSRDTDSNVSNIICAVQLKF